MSVKLFWGSRFAKCVYYSSYHQFLSYTITRFLCRNNAVKMFLWCFYCILYPVNNTVRCRIRGSSLHVVQHEKTIAIALRLLQNRNVDELLLTHHSMRFCWVTDDSKMHIEKDLCSRISYDVCSVVFGNVDYQPNLRL